MNSVLNLQTHSNTVDPKLLLVGSVQFMHNL